MNAARRDERRPNRRTEGRRGPRLPILVGVAFAMLSIPAPAQEGPGLGIHLTSPLGRTGMEGPIRIVARVVTDASAKIGPIRFTVDGKLVGEDTDGPPYAVEWVDRNPFEDRVIVADVTDSLGRHAEDRVQLKAQEMYEITEVSSVLLEPLVLDRKGRPINGLTAEDFHVTEDGIAQLVDLAVPDTLPAVYTLLVDSSQSMSRRMPFVRNAAAQFVGFLRPHDRVVVVPFSRTLGAVTGPTLDRDTVADAIQAIQASGGTAILDCLSEAARQVSSVDGRHIIVLITDGYDENSRIAFDDALQTVAASKATVYVIAIGGVAGVSLKGEGLLRRLAVETGGQAFFPARNTQLADTHSLIADDIQQRYVVTYSSTNSRQDGTWRTIAMTTGDPTHAVKVRNGYWAPSPPPIRPQIEMTIKDLNREFIDVTAEDFEVLEDGVSQQVNAFEEALAPVSVVLALDSSGSMRRDAGAVTSAAKAFVEALPAKDKLAVLTFADRVEWAHELTAARAASLGAIGRYAADGGTALYDAVFEGLARLKHTEGRTALVVMTDGRDENNPGTAPGSTHTFDQVLQMLGAVDTTVYTIGLGPRVDRDVLERLAEASAGESYFPSDVAALEQEYRRILENLRRRYILSYDSTNRTRDGAWRKVEIRPKRQGLIVESRGGYTAPDQR
ncbi:MAG: VWA domain-containing protein [Acidobacteria bacterium]|nr:VWA domain-containing protein [Acidobacteriota bacterium]